MSSPDTDRITEKGIKTNVFILGRESPRSQCTFIADKNHNRVPIQIYSVNVMTQGTPEPVTSQSYPVNVMTHVIALDGVQSGQGRPEPVTSQSYPAQFIHDTRVHKHHVDAHNLQITLLCLLQAISKIYAGSCIQSPPLLPCMFYPPTLQHTSQGILALTPVVAQMA